MILKGLLIKDLLIISKPGAGNGWLVFAVAPSVDGEFVFFSKVLQALSTSRDKIAMRFIMIFVFKNYLLVAEL